MLDYVFGHDEIVANFVASLIPECRERGFGKCAAMGVVNASGELIGGVVWRNWCPEVGTIEISGAALPGTNWLSRRTLQLVYDYPFYQCGCHMVIQTTMADNEPALIVKAKIGFTFYKIRHLGGPDRDGVLATLTKDQWENSKFNANRRRIAEQKEAA
jgi:RimJ/RimL family protein N-acetyltransferase